MLYSIVPCYIVDYRRCAGALVVLGSRLGWVADSLINYVIFFFKSLENFIFYF
jgi:hypothetical protein